MNRFVLTISFLCSVMIMAAQWKPVEGKMMTRWADSVDVQSVLPEYPRPLAVREQWQNLNGLWRYAITPATATVPPMAFEGDILVPFAVESALSGVGRTVGPDSLLWYRRTFSVPRSWKDRRILLHFGAVDWKTEVWVNGIKVGVHTGGYTPFTFDVTAAVNSGVDNELLVKVWDPTDAGYQPVGKQVRVSRRIRYTSVTGIWQTVWLEPVSQRYIENVRLTPDIDRNILSVSAELNASEADDVISVEVFDEGKLVASGKALNEMEVEVDMPSDVKLWSPDHPFLYDVRISIYKGGKLLDMVESYAAMRKYSVRRDQNGKLRTELNNKFLFQFGVLDQGWWPDGLYTAPTDAALVADIQAVKDLGFNMIRKHVKVEPARWYAYCDRIGLIVWQDMPSGDVNAPWHQKGYFEGGAAEIVRTPESQACYKKEWKEVMDALYSYPCICTWTPFNEGWGQFNTVEIAEWTKQYDPTRLVSATSGGNHYRCGDFLDVHGYPAPKIYQYDSERAMALGEFGGIGRPIEGHLWIPKQNWGYIQFKDEKAATEEYVKYMETFLDQIEKGYTVGVYTQLTDVEKEVNGIFTYDRKLLKFNSDAISAINRRIVQSLEKIR